MNNRDTVGQSSKSRLAVIEILYKQCWWSLYSLLLKPESVCFRMGKAMCTPLTSGYVVLAEKLPFT